MDKKLRRYFLTPNRLTKIPHFYKTIRMIKQINPNQEVHVPAKTEHWFAEEWHTITPGNATICIDHGVSSPSNYSMGNHTVEAKALYKEALVNGENTYFLREILGHTEYTTEVMVDDYINNRLIDRLKKQGSQELDAIITNTEVVKLYQIEKCWKAHPKFDIFGAHRDLLEKLPSYILEKLLHMAITYDSPTYHSSRESENIFREALRRGLLQKGFATTIINSTLKTLPNKKTAGTTE